MEFILEPILTASLDEPGVITSGNDCTNGVCGSGCGTSCNNRSCCA